MRLISDKALRDFATRQREADAPLQAWCRLIERRTLKAAPREVLRFLMAEHGLRQTGLAGIASQGTISDILGGRRDISRALAKKLAIRFQLSAGVFL